jgi:hypothetical protein
MQIANPFINITHVIGSLREADVDWESADTIKLNFRFQCPRRYEGVFTQPGSRHDFEGTSRFDA